jgi:hypothetical protein
VQARSGAVHLIWIEYDFFFSRQFFLDFAYHQVEMTGTGNIVQVVGWHRKDRAKPEIPDPLFI